MKRLWLNSFVLFFPFCHKMTKKKSEFWHDYKVLNLLSTWDALCVRLPLSVQVHSIQSYIYHICVSCNLSVCQIILHSMHKYQPRVHVIRKECGEELSPVRAVPAGEGTRTFSFPETVFTTVTAYQNQQVPTADPCTTTFPPEANFKHAE